MLYHIVTFGCQMNVHESEKLAGVLEKLGYFSTNDINLADIIVFNTCAVREGAQDRAFGNIGNLKNFKKIKPDLIIAVCGCMTQQRETANKLYEMFPFVDIIFGTHNFDKFQNFLVDRIKNKKRIIDLIDDNTNLTIWEDFPLSRTSGDNAWVNIMFGCNNFCSYCIVPYVRGREKSRTKESIINEVKKIVKTNKYKTITLLGQNVNSYGNGLYDNYSFADLLTDICKIKGDFKLTFMTSHPKDISDRLIDVMANEPKIIPELHLPIQSGSDKILKAMNRNYTVENYLNIINKLKTKISCIRLSSDFIVGFPGETEDDFNATLNIVKKVKFDKIFAFMYSPRSGTKAEKFDNQIALKVKNERVNRVLNLQKIIHKGN